jgi:magnesium transporter
MRGVFRIRQALPIHPSLGESMGESDQLQKSENKELGEESTSLDAMDFSTTHLDDVLEEQLESAFHQDTAQVILDNVAKIARENDPVDLAHIVTRLPHHARVVVYDNLPDLDAKIIFMINTTSSTRTTIFRQITDIEIKELLENMPPDEAVWMLDDMSDRRMKRVLELIEPKKAQRIRDLQRHDRDSAGRLMTNEFFSFHLNTTVGEVAAAIRDNPGIELTRRIFVYDSNQEMIGYVSARSLIVSHPYIPVRQIMRPIHHKVRVDASRDEVVDIVERYKISTLPVVDEKGRMVGVISYEDVVEAMEDIADETIARIGGTSEDVTEHDPIYKRALWRAPWLFVTLLAGLFTSSAMIHFSNAAWFQYMSFFVPLIAGMSGNVGIQCSTTLVRSMSLGELSYKNRRPAIVREIGIGLLTGTVFGLVCGLVVFTLYQLGFNPQSDDELRIGITVAAGLFAACMSATFLGTFSPFLFARFNIDPAVASGPIVTAFNDVLASQFFFLVARTLYIFLS